MMIKYFICFIRIILLIIISFNFAYAHSLDGLQLFSSEDQAQQHCPDDTVVWLNLPTGIWHYSGSRWYGHTKHGAYVCEQAAAAAGDRATKTE